MKRRIIISISFWAVSALIPQCLHAFENIKTHPALTERAITGSTLDDYLKTQLGLNDGINAQLSYNFPSEIQTRIERAQWDPGKTQRPVLEWLKVGSAIEDTDTFLHMITDKYSIRARHHFLDPTRNAGLNNQANHPEWRTYAPAGGTGFVFDFTGQSALIWAVNGTATQNPTTNNQAWQSSRTDFYNSLTGFLKNDREQYLAMTFLDLGCDLHMIEDMGVPSHTRNDFLFDHYRTRNANGNPLEKHVEKIITVDKAIGLNRWLPDGWQPTPAVFSKVANYFDADIYTDKTQLYLYPFMYYIAPSDPALNGWGLSERTNYQFLSWSTIFKPLLSNDLYYFPHPAKTHTNEIEESGRVYLTGYEVGHLARRTISADYLHYGDGDHLNRAWSILGENVWDDYAAITIPRTIDYATGLINYFFRGKLEITGVGMDEVNRVKITIKNKSTNGTAGQVLVGGTFDLYWDDQAGNRTRIGDDFIVDNWIEGVSTLGYNDEITASFPVDVFVNVNINLNNLIVIYKGPINSASAPDTTDTDDISAIAIGTLRVGELLTWTWVELPCCPYFPCEPCGDDYGSQKTKIAIWNVSESSGIPQNVKDGTFDVYYLDFETYQLIPLASVTGSLDYCEECEGEWGPCLPQPVLEINKGVMEYIVTHGLIVVYSGTMVDSENPNNEYHAAAIVIDWISSIGGHCHGEPDCGCPW